MSEYPTVLLVGVEVADAPVGGDATEEHYLLAREALGAAVDFTQIMRFLERWARFELPISHLGRQEGEAP